MCADLPEEVIDTNATGQQPSRYYVIMLLIRISARAPVLNYKYRGCGPSDLLLAVYCFDHSTTVVHPAPSPPTQLLLGVCQDVLALIGRELRWWGCPIDE
jgi:hypothetical protein